MKPYKIINNYVFIVYEFPNEVNKSGHIHGVYVNRSEAEGKVNKLNRHFITGVRELAILKKSVLGKGR